MSASRPVVWAVVRDLGRTGVPIALARLATWPGTAEAIDLHVVARTDGPVRHDLEAAGVSVTALEPAGARTVPAALAAGSAHLGRPGPGAAVRSAAWRHRTRGLPHPDTVLVQGAGAWPVAAGLHRTEGARVVLHLHELEVALGRSLTGPALEAATRADQVLVVAEPVAALAREVGVPADRVALVPGTVAPSTWTALPDAAEPVRTASTTSGIDVVSIGETGWRKGTDRAIAAAHELRRLDPAVRWHWIGRPPEPGWGFAHGAELPVAFHPPVADPWSVIRSPGALVVTSREDPLPLVALEAGARGVPVVATAGSGGLDDLLGDGRGVLVDPTDPHDLAAAVHAAATVPSPEQADALRAHLLAHHRVEVVGPRWLAALTATP